MSEHQITPNSKRVKEHRQRKKDGANIYKIAIKQDRLNRVKILSKSNEDKTLDELFNIIVDSTLSRFDIAVNEAQRLLKLGASQDVADQYGLNEVNRLMPLTAEQFLNGER